MSLPNRSSLGFWQTNTDNLANISQRKNGDCGTRGASQHHASQK